MRASSLFFLFFFYEWSSIDYINGVVYELENGESSKPSKEDWDSAITFTARSSGKKKICTFEKERIFYYRVE